MLRGVKIRLYPNATQATQINMLLGCYRVVYNQCLARKIKSYEENKVNENRTTLGHFVHHELLKDENFIWLNEQNTKVLKQAVIDMLTAYKNFFERHTGYPKFKSKKDNKQSCRFELGAISKKNIYTDYKLSLANIKEFLLYQWIFIVDTFDTEKLSTKDEKSLMNRIKQSSYINSFRT